MKVITKNLISKTMSWQRYYTEDCSDCLYWHCDDPTEEEDESEEYEEIDED